LFHYIVWVKDLLEKGWFEETRNFTFTHDLTADLTLEMDKDISFSRFLVGKKNRAGITNQGTSGNATGLDVLIMLSNNDNK
jgi:hypothetical protein